MRFDAFVCILIYLAKPYPLRVVLFRPGGGPTPAKPAFGTSLNAHALPQTVWNAGQHTCLNKPGRVGSKAPELWLDMIWS